MTGLIQGKVGEATEPGYVAEAPQKCGRTRPELWVMGSYK